MNPIRKSGMITAAILGALGITLTLTGSRCVLRELTGIPCPGCGMTRALRCLLRLDFPGAWQQNPFCFLLPILLLLVLFDGSPFRSIAANRILLTAIVLSVTVSYAAKLLVFFG